MHHHSIFGHKVESLFRISFFCIPCFKGNSPQAASIAQKIEKKMEELNNKLQNAVIAQVAEDFMDTTTNLKQLEKAARSPPGR